MLSLCYIIFKSRKDILEGNSDFSEKIQPKVLHENLLKIHINDPELPETFTKSSKAVSSFSL